jgi:hypothetical protein
MTLDLHWMVNGLLGLVLFGVGWFCRELWAAVQQLRKDLSTLENRISRDYVSYDRLRDVMQPVLDALGEIKATLKDKADKS